MQGLGKVRTWKIAHQHGDALAVDVDDFLPKLSDDLAVNSNLESYLDDVAGFDAYKAYRSSKTDVLDAIKNIQSQGKLFGKFDLVNNPGCIGHLDADIEKVLLDDGWEIIIGVTTPTHTSFKKFTGESSPRCDTTSQNEK